MPSISINRGERTAIPFAIVDPANGLNGKRVTWSVAAVAGGRRVLRKVSAMPGSSADITITTQTSGSIVGTINIAVEDYALLPFPSYVASLWIDGGDGNDRCVTVGGADSLVIMNDVARSA